MKCKSCGFNNDDSNRFCSNCGRKLPSVKDLPSKAKSISIFNKGNVKRKNHSLKANSPNLKPLWITVGVVIVSIFIAISFDLVFHKYPDTEKSSGEIKSSNPVVEAQVTAIASKFVCSCGTNECNSTSLETCTCDIAGRERQFIRNKLEKNEKPDDIVVDVANKYGNLKSGFAAKYKVSPDKVWEQN